MRKFNASGDINASMPSNLPIISLSLKVLTATSDLSVLISLNTMAFIRVSTDTGLTGKLFTVRFCGCEEAHEMIHRQMRMTPVLIKAFLMTADTYYPPVYRLKANNKSVLIKFELLYNMIFKK